MLHALGCGLLAFMFCVFLLGWAFSESSNVEDAAQVVLFFSTGIGLAVVLINL